MDCQREWTRTSRSWKQSRKLRGPGKVVETVEKEGLLSASLVKEMVNSAPIVTNVVRKGTRGKIVRKTNRH